MKVGHVMPSNDNGGGHKEEQDLHSTTASDVGPPQPSPTRNAFRPANPGKGPVHGMTTSSANFANGQNGERRFVSINKDDFRPTEPGHSPGAGHSHHLN
ncbi:precursor of CEP9 [Humulus lupulus]|uniref:precursor of CEP9 n=1 Tax=Humulus lupulus TaxID=3486 RepID=UPI002B409801|nr:precursor of CEP9 [Humulus lupulus]